jgi:GrpB-like predicted nucleotidyltransferase (UPF0157 family)
MNVEIVMPSKKIFDLYSYFEKKIKKALPESKTRLIGSFAVPMAGKKEVDILVEIKDVENALNILDKAGFSKGPIFKGEGFLHGKKEEFVCELHVLEPGDERIRKVYDRTINAFKNNKDLREKFEKLKFSMNGKSEEEYKKMKSKFLKENVFLE